MIYIPYIVSEHADHALQQVPVQHFSAGDETFHDVVGNFRIRDFGQCVPFGKMPEKAPALKDAFHRIDPGAHENEGARRFADRTGCADFAFQCLEEVLASIGVNVLELTEQHHHRSVSFRRQCKRQMGDGIDFSLACLAGVRKDMAAVGITHGVEDQRGPCQKTGGHFFKFILRRGYRREQRSGIPADEQAGIMYGSHIHITDNELLAGCPHVQESLLDCGHLAGFQRGPEDNVFPLGKEIGHCDTILSSAGKVLSCHVFGKLEWRIHEIFGFSLTTNSYMTQI